MPIEEEDTVTCQICGKTMRLSEVRPAAIIRQAIVDVIRTEYPEWSSEGFICVPDLNRFREEYVKDVLAKGNGEVSALEEQVIASLKEHELLSVDVNAEFEGRLGLL